MDYADKRIMCCSSITREQQLDYDWGYTGFDGDEPENWANHYPNVLTPGQSPINIDTSVVVHDRILEQRPLRINVNGNRTKVQRVLRCPHNFCIRVEGDGILCGGPLKPQETYRLCQIMFHFTQGEGGSEHTIDNQKYVAECQLTFWNTKYQGYRDAVSNLDGVAIISVMYNLNHHYKHPGVDNMLKAYFCLDERRMECDVKSPVDINTLLPSNTSHYFTYQGSLTTPPCNQCVTWIVMRHTMTMQKNQFDLLSQTHSHRRCCATGSNVRPLQPLAGRIVYTSNCRHPHTREEKPKGWPLS